MCRNLQTYETVNLAIFISQKLSRVNLHFDVNKAERRRLPPRLRAAIITGPQRRLRFGGGKGTLPPSASDWVGGSSGSDSSNHSELAFMSPLTFSCSKKSSMRRCGVLCLPLVHRQFGERYLFVKLAKWRKGELKKTVSLSKELQMLLNQKGNPFPKLQSTFFFCSLEKSKMVNSVARWFKSKIAMLQKFFGQLVLNMI